MINGATLGTNVILTGFLEEALEGLAEMVIMETSSIGINEIKIFSNKISCYSSGAEHLISTNDNQQVGWNTSGILRHNLEINQPTISSS